MGSSRSGRYRTRPTLRSLLRLDVLTLRRELRDGAAPVLWGWSSGARMLVQPALDFITLGYSVGDEPSAGPVVERIAVVHLPCQYGGTRPLFHCPRCARRARLLYLYGRRWVCRECTGLRYWSQSVASRTRTQMEIHKVQRKLAPGEDVSGWDVFDAPEERPKRMRRRTHRHLLERLAELQDRYIKWNEYELDRRWACRGGRFGRAAGVPLPL